MNPGVQKTFARIMSMLVCWHPIIHEIEYYQCIAFPFIKVFHKSPVRCFEILVTLIGSWCQNWFLFCPFPPFNILCVIENIISYHDQKLMRHFMQLNISAEIYGWNLLQTSFSEVFNKRQWLKLWDNIFSNRIGFLMYCAAAFNIVMRDVLLRCKTLEQFKGCYRKHGISASILIQKAYDLQQSSPPEIDPEPVVGSFASIPKGAYPTFFQMSQMNIDLQTLTRKRIIDQEVHFMQQREDALEITHNYLKELQDLQLLRRKFLLDCIDWTDVDALEVLHKKLIKVQNLIQSNLTDQVAMLKGLIGENIFGDGKE
ncbi:WD repeat-containing protein 67, partial [Stegodyphus mimosarum]